MPAVTKNKVDSFVISKAEVVQDYMVAFKSRIASLTGRKEVLSGKAKFGIFGGGKEVAQVAMAKAFKHGDWRSGYYRDQTFMFALGAINIKQFFAQLYADADVEREPSSGGRQMNSHFASRFLDENGNWLNQLMMHNTSADASPTASQMARLLGLGYASKLYRENQGLQDLSKFSVSGNEIAFGTIGNASTSEGVFWECLNAAGVLEVPLIVSVWDDDYGISVHSKYQTTKESISKICAGFEKEEGTNGLIIEVVEGWNYVKLCEVYQKVAERVRKEHIPALIHVIEMTQPQGHSTSGSQERYKSPDRIKYEQSLDCISKMRQWMLDEDYVTEQEIEQMESDAEKEVEKYRKESWEEFLAPMENERKEILGVLGELQEESPSSAVEKGISRLKSLPVINRKALISIGRRILIAMKDVSNPSKEKLIALVDGIHRECNFRYSSHLTSESDHSPLKVDPIPAVYSKDSEEVDGRVVIQKIFDHHLGADPRVFIIGEDVGKLGGVNLEFEGLHDKYGEGRVTDTGIREATILGQGIGAALRGLRPIVDIQYLDYMLYCFQVMSDDLACLHYRTAGGQIAPVIVRSKGHRLEGVWHSGSPMGTLIHGSRGMHICVPRNMVQAAGMYNTLLAGDDPALVVEVLSGFRLKEKVPDNLADFRVPLGVPEILREGNEVTIVTYGACVRIAMESAELLSESGIEAEVIDVQTLLPFDSEWVISESLKKTNTILFVDEDVPGGATGYMMQQVLEKQKGYEYLDARPRTLSSHSHRVAYGSDGDYFSKPNADDIFDAVYQMLRAREPNRFPEIR